MIHLEKAALIDEIDDLLDAERADLLAGNFDGLAMLMSKKEAIIDRLANLGRADDRTMRALRTKAARNQSMLRAAQDGIQEVGARLKAMQEVESTLSTYGAMGERCAFVPPRAGSLEHRI